MSSSRFCFPFNDDINDVDDFNFHDAVDDSDDVNATHGVDDNDAAVDNTDDMNDPDDNAADDDDTVDRAGVRRRGGAEDAAVLSVRRHGQHGVQNGIQRRR